MIKWIKSFIWDMDKPTITPNSMSPIPTYKFNNLARDKHPVEEDKEPFKNVYEFKNWEKKSLKQKKQIMSYSQYFDYYNH